MDYIDTFDKMNLTNIYNYGNCFSLKKIMVIVLEY